MLGVGLLLAVLLAAVAWYSMSRSGSSSGSKAVLENQARMDQATTDVPTNASAHSEPAVPPSQSQEDIEKQLASMDSASSNAN